MANTSSKFQCVQNVLCTVRRLGMPKAALNYNTCTQVCVIWHVEIMLQLASEDMILRGTLCVFRVFAIDSNLT